MHIDSDLKGKVESLFNSGQKNMADALGIEFSYISMNKLEAMMPVNKNTTQPFGLLHGGASVALAETVCSVGAWLNLSDEKKMAVGLEINANHLRPVRKGNMVKCISQPVRLGNSIQVWKNEIYSESGKLICISRCTIAVVNRR
jgi:uncharacterized protein (TIGR00369 family)